MVQNNTKFKQTEIGEIPENWEILELDSLLNKKNQGVNTTTEKVSYSKSGVPIVRANNITDYSIDFKDLVYVDSDNYSRIRTDCRPHKGDILYTNIGSQFGSAVLVKDDKEFGIAWNVMRMQPNIEKIVPGFLVYLLNNPKNKFEIKSLNSSSTMPFVSGGELGKTKFIIPTIDEQKQIALILSSLDDKIELNQKTIKTLEETGQSLFKRWFIDFEFPNEKGDPYKSSGGEMVDSELGEIPKGWSVGTVKDIATVKSGFAFKSDDLKDQGDFGIVKIKNVNDGVVNIRDVEYISEDISKKAINFKLSFGDILIAMSGNTTGKIGIMPKTDLIFYLNQRVGKYFIKDKKEILKGFLYFCITRPDIKQNTIEKAYGSAQPNISPSILESCEIVIPPTNEFETIFNFFNQIIFEISEKTYEIAKMSNLRDSLLPKLLSGKMRV